MKLSDRQTSPAIKMLLIGDSGTGKTGALASLALAGYRIIILDFDNGLDILAPAINAQAKTPEEAQKALENVNFEQFTDEYTIQGKVMKVKGYPQAFSNALSALNKFPDIGNLSDLDPTQDVVVIDSLTLMCEAVYNYEEATTANKDGRMTYWEAQKRIEKFLQMMYSTQFKPNVIVNSHVTFIETDEGVTRGYPSSLGKALSPKIPRMFNTVLECKSYGSGAASKRYILTKPSGIVELKNPIIGLPDRLPQATGLVEFFSAFKSMEAAS